ALTITVNAHNKHKSTKPKCSTPTPTPACCESRGSPGWNDETHVSAVFYKFFNVSTPQDCCKACIGDLNCIEWEFLTRRGACAGYNNFNETCSSATQSPSDIGDEAGNIRCSDGDGSG
ncbi:8493_t:CDS:1, partial [Cetraspora pellucida]